MNFSPTTISGVYLIQTAKNEDERGHFTRTWCCREFEQQGIGSFVQSSVSFNHQAGTLRGMHFQAAPHPDAKLVRCSQGAIFDVILDIRRNSPTYHQWAGFELTAENQAMLFVPHGCAHGFITLADRSEVSYLISDYFVPELGRGIRWNDPVFRIKWPREPVVMSERDRTLMDYSPSLDF